MADRFGDGRAFHLLNVPDASNREGMSGQKRPALRNGDEVILFWPFRQPDLRSVAEASLLPSLVPCLSKQFAASAQPPGTAAALLPWYIMPRASSLGRKVN